MISQQVLDYIRQQQTAGVTKEEIKKALISQGWNEQDIDQTFAALQPAAPIPNPVPSPTAVPAMTVPQAKVISEAVVAKPSTVNTTWTKGIPRTNIGFMVVSLLLVFGLDLTILVNSPDLAPFFIAMVVVLGIFGIFFYLENYVFKKRFSFSQSKLDTWISVLAVIRNLAFVLNFIPFIQLLGGAALVFGGIPYLIIYSILIAKRRSVSPQVS